MSVRLQIEEAPDYLAARFIGAVTIEEVAHRFEVIAEQCKRANKNKLLLDFTEAHIEGSLADRYFLGEQALIFARYGLKVAGVGRPEQLDPQKLAEMVAQNRWVNLCGFTNVEDAEKWLSE